MPSKSSNLPKDTAGKKHDASPQLPSLCVAIGASAGGLEAIESFFSGMPSDSGLAFIVIQHLSPDYKSLMKEILSKKTSMNVNRAEDGMKVLPNNIYLIPPKKNMTIFHGKLLLSDQDPLKGVLKLPIDIFLRSLADDQGEKAVAVILSGSGSDGMRGVRAIKESGGMTMVQNEKSAKFDSMPRAAISTGLVDFILSPEEMSERLISYARHPYVLKTKTTEKVVSNEDALTRIFSLLRERFKVDFTYYKPTTMNRRIERRMSVNRIDEIRDYVAYMQNYPAEVSTLFKELLIGVTRFFRDRDAFDALRHEYLPEVLNRSINREMRFWVTGCSTGEEAYTLAIIAREHMIETGNMRDLKIFATDIDREAVQYAATGLYPESIIADIPQDLLNKYFYKKEDNYQITRNIREMVVFAQHNLIKDPPFTNIEFISCRNLLIYLQPVLQKKVLEFFNFSLNPDGILFLGTSETTGDMEDYFQTLHHKFKVYRSKGRVKKGLNRTENQQPTDTRYRDMSLRYSRAQRDLRAGDTPFLERLLETLSEEFISLVVVVNEHMEVLHVIGDTDGYLKLPSGKLSMDISRMAVKELTIPLSTGIQKVLRQKEPVRFSNIRVHSKNGDRFIDLRIKPLKSKKGQEELLVLFMGEVEVKKPSGPEKAEQTYDVSQEAEQRINDLEQELMFTRENLQATVEELETSNEELQATNEELMSSNEELQSTNEELQSTNEELYSVNAEYQSKIMELSELHGDVDNLLSASQMGNLLLDENMEIRRFSPKITEIFKLLDTDVGRPLIHISHHILDLDPVEKIKEVQNSDTPSEHEVRTKDGKWYLMRIVPYVVGPEVFSGTLISFVDITRIRETEESLRVSEEKHRQLFETMAQGVIYQASDGRIISANPAAEKILGLSLDQMRGKTSMDPRWKMIKEDETEVPGNDHPAMIALKTGKNIGPVTRGVFHPDKNTHIWLSITAIPLFRPGDDLPYQAYATFENITEQKLAQEEVRLAHQRLLTVLDSIDALIYVADMETHEILFMNKHGQEIFGNVSGKKCWQVLQSGQDGPCSFCTNEKLLDAQGNSTGIYTWEFFSEKTNKHYQCFDRAIQWVDGRMVRLESAFDITPKKQSDNTQN
ncbi:MAG: PAS domain S-box protein [Desulfonatronovibrio sp. MSAO_Bac4]|nr:MAG: PAS domain S-box protein [Desulfonatronovibrio sp. MSAO_Bac4]